MNGLRALRQAPLAARRLLSRSFAGEPAVFRAPLLIPGTEALDVHLKGLAAALESEPLHEDLVLADRGLARVAFLQRSWTAPDSRDVIIWQSAVAELLSDE